MYRNAKPDDNCDPFKWDQFMLWILLTWGTAENIQALYAQKVVKKGLDLVLKPSDIIILFIMVAGG